MIAVLALPILLGACALPASFTIASLAVNGFSYATSGKGLGDHAISAVADEDCAVWRVLLNRPICRAVDMPEAVVAAAAGVAAAPAPGGSEVLAVVLAVAPGAGGPTTPETVTTEPHDEFEVTAAAFAALSAADESIQAAAPAPDGSEVMVALAVAPAVGGPMAPETATTETPAAPASSAKRPTAMAATQPEPLAATTETPARLPKSVGGQATTAAPADRGTAAKPVQLAILAVPLPKLEAKPKRGRFVVLGSYFKEAHARAAMKLGQAFAPRMARVRVRGRLYYRVVSGPYARSSIATMRRTLIGEGFPDAWAATLCQDTLRLTPCGTAPAPLDVSTN